MISFFMGVSFGVRHRIGLLPTPPGGKVEGVGVDVDRVGEENHAAGA